MPQNAALMMYRELLRASRRTFKGDTLALNTVQSEIRTQFIQHKDISSSEVESKLNDAKEAVAFIQENIVQAKKKDCGTLEVANKEDAEKLQRMQREEDEQRKAEKRK